jgi:hypothetical protein
MANNPFYNYDQAFVAGTLGRAEAVGTEFTSVQSGFALLTIQGVDTGAANAYVVNVTGGGPSGSYSDGQVIEFKATNANTGGCTINVNSIGVVGLTNSQGQALGSGAITVNTWILCRYNSTFSAFTLIAPSSLTTTSATVSAAAPPNKVGLTAAAGVANSVLPSDATYALDQSIAPTWTGAHTFSGAVTFSAAPTFSAGLGTITGPASTYAATFDGAAAVGTSFGVKIAAGTNSSDVALLITSQSGTAFAKVDGAGSATIGSPTGGGQGVGTLNATGLFVNGVAVLTSSAVGANPTAKVGLTAVNGSATTFMRSDGAPPIDQAIAPTWTAAHVFSPSSAVVPITIDCAVNTGGLKISGATNTANAYLLQLVSGQGSGFSSGLSIQAGTAAGDAAVLIVNAANTAVFFEIFGNGSGNVGATATAGMQWTTTGAITLNATSGTPLTVEASGTAIFKALGTTAPTIQGYGPTAAALVDLTPDQGTFTGTLKENSGATTLTTGTLRWARVGPLVCLFFPGAFDASGSHTDLTMTGLPAVIQPVRAQTVKAADFAWVNNGVQGSEVDVTFAASSGTLTFAASGSNTGWVGTKGSFLANCLFYYLL